MVFWGIKKNGDILRIVYTYTEEEVKILSIAQRTVPEPVD